MFETAYSFIALLLLIPLSEGQSLTPIAPQILFKNGNEPDLTRNKTEEPDIQANDGELVDFLKTTTEICCTGVWWFYPEPEFSYAPREFPGYQIGHDEKERCFDIGSHGVNLSSMGSFRAIGPAALGIGGMNLNQMTITLYSGEYTSGSSRTLTSTDFYGLMPITRLDSYKSFAITGVRDNIPGSPNDHLAPVFNMFWDSDADPLQGSLCVVLEGMHYDGNRARAKFHLQHTMTFDDNGSPTEIGLGALQYTTLSDLNLVTCSYFYPVPADPAETIGQAINLGYANE